MGCKCCFCCCCYFRLSQRLYGCRLASICASKCLGLSLQLASARGVTHAACQLQAQATLPAAFFSFMNRYISYFPGCVAVAALEQESKSTRTSSRSTTAACSRLCCKAVHCTHAVVAFKNQLFDPNVLSHCCMLPSWLSSHSLLFGPGVHHVAKTFQ